MAINGSMFDRFTLAHMGAGFLGERVGLGPVSTALLGVTWEIVEDSLKDEYPRAFPHPSHDSKANALGDVLGVMAGWVISRWLR